jgi:hypothetical protein
MLRIRRDPTGVLARLQCDECARRSMVFVAGRRIPPEQVRAVHEYLRGLAASLGWGTMPSLDQGQPVRIDLCRRCARRLRQIL